MLILCLVSVDLLVLLILCNSPEEVGIVIAVITGYGAFCTVTNHHSAEVLGHSSNRLHCVRTCRTLRKGYMFGQKQYSIT